MRWFRVALVAVVAVELVAMLAVIGYRSFGPPDDPGDVALGLSYRVASGFVADADDGLRDLAAHYREGLGAEADLRDKVAAVVAVVKTDADQPWKATGYLLAITPTGDPDFPDGRVLVTVGVYVEVTVGETTVTAGLCEDLNMTLGQWDMRPPTPASCDGRWGRDGRPVPGYGLMS
ncbi:hypothetical protein Afil01_09730 [Actinorhabdospora filicis]|uniref:Uncharacterized protein n=1 Tax=Actinorhabdospora filicis TaxID=1785913 RepID=A0A9W6SKA5_9ACTN|nr:hypothetical protein [Actinorhabdospora filicis]GLZ76166.1 hypothetical protein Afil01_09730 [Actinorhabdospora filicis]